MKKNVFHFAVLFVLFGVNMSHAQKWVRMMHDPDANFYEVQKEFNAYWKNRTITKGNGYKQFKRWEYIMQSRVDRNGRLPAAGYVQQQLEQYQLQHAPSEKRSTFVANWTAVGPKSAAGLEGGIGRVQCFAMDPNANTNYWAGTPGGGLWKSTDAGATWVPKTDHFVSLGVSWILIHPANSSIMYVSTGDPDGGGTASTGVLKSTDGGNTWTQTSLSFPTNQYKQINLLRFFPGNPNTLFAATSDGIYRSTNSGTSWTLVHNVSRIFDIEFHPTTPATMYASGYGKLYKSTDSGATWTELTSGLPTTGGDKSLVAVTPHAPDNVYYLTTMGNAVNGMYKSTNKGVSFSALSSHPSVGAQAWWDLVLEVNPADQNKIYVGGVWFSNSSDGGASWNAFFGNMHVDHHNMFFYGNTWFACNDGGLYRSTDGGDNWQLLHQGMEIMQFYRMSAFAYEPGFILGGSQDNGTSRLRNNAWKQVMGADGMDNAMSGYNSNVVWASTQNGYLSKSTDGGNSFMGTNGNISEPGAWVTPFILNPNNHDSVLTGFQNVWKSNAGGNVWTKISNFTDGGVIEKVLTNWNNPSVIYISRGGGLWKTSNGGTAWTHLNSPTLEIPVFRAFTIDPKNSNRIWAAAPGVNTPGKKAYYSADGGTTWTNISGTLPDVPMLCMEYLPGSNDGIYIGSDIGVFYKDASMSDWEYYNEGLPHVRVEDLDVNLGSGKIRAATYGRGIWESPLHEEAGGKPVADFEASTKTGCIGNTIAFRDYSYKATSWNWSFPGGTPASSTSQHPSVTYSTNGTFNVTLTVSNANGSSTKTRQGVVVISGQVVSTYPYVQNFDQLTTGDTVNLGGWVNGTDDNKNWFVHTGPAPARIGEYPEKAGPKADHTSGSGKYLLYESGMGGGVWANLYSPCFNLGGISSPVLEYYEHVFGVVPEDGELHLDIQTEGTWYLDVIPVEVQVGDVWLKKTVDLSAYSNKVVRLRFRARASYAAKGFALDDIRISPKQNAAPAADFVASTTSGLLGMTVKFYDQSTNLPAGYSWSFPGGTPGSSSAVNPEVVYNTAGQYNVTLTATNAHGSNSITKTAYIKVSGAVYNMNNQTVTDCLGRLFDSGGEQGDYGNNEQRTFIIAPPGAQQVKLKFFTWGLSDNDAVSFYDGTSAAAPLIGTYGGFFIPSEINANSGAITLRFNSDNEGTSSGFKIEWEAIGGDCSPGTTVPAPIAAFSSTQTTGNAPFSPDLNDNSQNYPVGWTWLLPGANPSRLYGKNVYASYETPGTYDVSLIVVNEGGRDTLTKSGFITVTAPPVEINMHTGTVTACKGTLYDDGGPNANYLNNKTYTLVIQPSGATSISMNFSQWALENNYDFLRIYNGTSASAPLLGSWSGTSPGTVTANSGAMTLRFTSDGGVNAAGWTAAWTATGGSCSPVVKPVADFSANPTTVTAGASVQFTDLSTNTPTSWNWTFQGGTPATSTVKNPSVTYSTAGTYSVSLTATNAAGSDTRNKTAYITVNPVQAPVADFSASATTVTAGASVQFTDLSTNTPTSWSWAFQGGTPSASTVKNPSVTYATAGTYSVSLTASNAGGTDTESKTGYITVTQAGVTINMKTGTETSCTGTLYDDGGPNANYLNNKSYTLVIQPSGATSVSMNFSQWAIENNYDFLRIYNGTSTSAPLLGVWSGTSPGTVTANSGAMTLRFTSDGGVNAAGWKATWSATGGTCSPAVTPVADFSANPTTVTTGASVQFTDLSTNTPTSWSWTFQGGTPAASTVKNPSVTYATAGTYSVSLTATNAAGSDTESKTGYITVTQAGVTINMKTGTETSCTGTLYDDGGPNANYLNNKNYTLVIQPSGATSISMNFSQWALENNYDFLRIYNGTSTSAPLLGSWSGTSPGTVTASSGAMTLRFTSDAAVNAAGWKATWTSAGGTCGTLPVPPASAPDKAQSEGGDVLIYPNPNSGEFQIGLNTPFEQLIITDITGQIIQKQRIQGNRIKIELLQQAPGIYFVQFMGKAGLRTHKVIVR